MRADGQLEYGGDAAASVQMGALAKSVAKERVRRLAARNEARR